MNTTSIALEPASRAMLRREISRFIEAARERGELDEDQRRRTQRRCHRSWPLLVSFTDRQQGEDMGVALHNASPLGIAFLCPRHIAAGTIVLIKLFWHDEFSPFIPAIVRHGTRNHHGYIIGCAFAVDSENEVQGDEL